MRCFNQVKMKLYQRASLSYPAVQFFFIILIHSHTNIFLIFKVVLTIKKNRLICILKKNWGFIFMWLCQNKLLFLSLKQIYMYFWNCDYEQAKGWGSLKYNHRLMKVFELTLSLKLLNCSIMCLKNPVSDSKGTFVNSYADKMK